jgi:UDP-3-O-[3-hydroxymyristoyl] N-acetylglucosamine deacetylase
MERQQRTIRRPIRLTGIGLHSGLPVHLDILPAKSNHGITFRRTDLLGVEPLLAHASNITSTELSTTLGHGQNSVSTIEHLMAALFGLGIDNAEIFLDGPEIPIMDGSSSTFVDAIFESGTMQLDAPKKVLVAKEAFEVRDGDRWMRISPCDELIFDCQIEYPSAAIGRQHLSLSFNRTSFLELSNSRTFCHVREVDAMRAAGLALGGSLDNAIVVTDTAVINETGLRSQNEFVRHKVLDAIGDLALLGAPLLGRITMHKNGHGLHALFMKELLKRSHFLLEEKTQGTIGPDSRPTGSKGLEELTAAAPAYN